MVYRIGRWLRMNVPYLLLTTAVFACTSWLAANLATEMCPDEAARTPLAWFIYRNGALPKGWEESIRIAQWGFSYGFSPYLTSILGSFFMRICSLFTADRSAMLFAIRLPSVISVTLATFFTCKLAEAIFDDWRAALLTGIIVGGTPQVLYLGGYHNCDSLALLSVTLIVYSWCRAWRMQSWSIGSLILMGLGISLCLLSYYNAYPFILFSILFYMISCTMFGTRWVEIFEGFLLVVCVVMALAGWYFVRNAALYEGDVFGLRMREKYGEAFATQGFRPSDKVTPKGLGMSVTDMLFYDRTFSKEPWLRYTLQSFFCMTGYMTEALPLWCEIGYYLVCGVGIISCLVVLFSGGARVREEAPTTHGAHMRQAEPEESEGQGKPSRIPALVVICLALSSFVTIGFAIYYSYAVDYQPQGRYIIACIVPLAVLVSCGFLRLRQTFTREGSCFLLADPCVWAGVLWLGFSVASALECFPPCLVGVVA